MDFKDCEELLEVVQDKARHVANWLGWDLKTQCCGLLVSTVLLPCDGIRAAGHGRLMYETMVFAVDESTGDYNGMELWVRRYYTQDQAVRTHLQVVETLRTMMPSLRSKFDKGKNYEENQKDQIETHDPNHPAH